MKVLQVIVDRVPKPGCMGRLEGEYYHPEPCVGVVTGGDLWCKFTGETIEGDNNPFSARPIWCPLVTKDD
jgi:hypothetical protein